MSWLQQRFLRPTPRVALGRQLRSLASAAMDVSDGVLTDVAKLCAASHCAAQIDVAALPVSAAMLELFAADARLEYALAGGDDYELIFTAAPDVAARLIAQQEPAVRITRIGSISAGEGVRCLHRGQPFVPPWRGYDHFA